MCTDKRPSEYTARRWLSVNQEKRTQEKPDLPTLWSWTSITQNWENKFLLCRPFRKIGLVHICYSHIGFWNTRILGSLEALSANPVSWTWATAAALKDRTWVCQAAWLAQPPLFPMNLTVRNGFPGPFRHLCLLPLLWLSTFAGLWRKQGSFRKTSISASLTTLKLLTVWISTNWKILKEMGIPDHLTCLLRNL